ncbi:MAG: hypothetical protein M1819_005188 [Sarea resinae]|nr:MAG: hypothetical protein M1819_005188 [Sarea resinae]
MSAARRSPAAPLRARRTRVDYREPSSDESFDETIVSDPSRGSQRNTERPSRRQPPRSTTAEQSKKRKRGNPSNTSSRAAPNAKSKRNATASKARPRRSQAEPNVAIEDRGVIPPWQDLPYEILLQIFVFASHPLCDVRFRPQPSADWLLSVSRVCKAFTEPALTALYNNPPLLPSDRPHGLLKLLSMPKEALSINYSAKVRSLELDVFQTLAYSTPGLGHFDLGALVRRTPQLIDLSLFHIADQAPRGYLSSARGARWNYPDSLFTALSETGIRLQKWRWNSMMAGPNQGLSALKVIHQDGSFHGLRDITFSNYDVSSKRSQKDVQETSDERHLAGALSVLPNLQSLIFENSTVVNDKLLPLLPKNLTQLTINNCYSLLSEDLDAFLLTHGSSLKEMTLDHNQSLDLTFLTNLATACPVLECLKMDLKYSKSGASLYSSDPVYESLLYPESVPSWPTTLQRLELVQLRKWTADTAEAFFRSLLRSAADLPCLRSLILKVILNIGWRDRANFRDRWIGRLQDVFLRKSAPPDPTLQSLRTFKRYKAEQFQGAGPPRVSIDESRRNSRLTTDSPRPEDGEMSSTRPQRRSVRLKELEDTHSATSLKRLRTGRRRSRPFYGSDSDDSRSETGSSADSDTERASRHADGEKVRRIQGMCEIVDVRIDNLRPAEDQFSEGDFLDSEASGDEDWDGTDRLPGEERYAW